MTDLVLGGGPAGLRAAACLEGARLLEPRNRLGGRAHPDLPEDRGQAEASAADVVSRRYGAAPTLDARAQEQGIWLGGALHTLPLQRRSLPKVLPRDQQQAALRDWVQTRGRVHLQRLIGGGFEQRSYRDWVIQHFGEGTFEAMYASYCQARFGPGDQVNVAVARQHHALPAAQAPIGLGASAQQGWEQLVSQVAHADTDVSVRSLETTDGRVSAVLTEQGRVQVEGRLWCAAAPAQVAGWLGDALTAEQQRHLRSFRSRHRVRLLMLRVGPGPDLPAELHVLDPAPFFRLSTPSRLPGGAALRGSVLVELSLDAHHPLFALDDAELSAQVAAAARDIGLPELDPSTARVERLLHYDPLQLGVWHPNHVRLSRELAAMGLQLLGRAACHRILDPSQELRFAEALAGSPDQLHEHQRVLLDPPIKLDDGELSITRFVER